MINEKLINIVPFQVFEPVVNNLKTEVSVTVTQNNGVTRLTGTFNNVEKGNIVNVDCGTLSGDYVVKNTGGWEETATYIEIEYDGAYTDGTVKTYPYFDWGNLKKLNESVNQSNQFPLIAMILPNPYSINTDIKSDVFISHVFTFLFLDTYKVAQNESYNETRRIYNECASSMSELTLDFIKELERSQYVKDFTEQTRSEEIPFGIALKNNETGKTEGVFNTEIAGCLLDMRVNIYKQFNC